MLTVETFAYKSVVHHCVSNDTSRQREGDMTAESKSLNQLQKM